MSLDFIHGCKRLISAVINYFPIRSDPLAVCSRPFLVHWRRRKLTVMKEIVEHRFIRILLFLFLRRFILAHFISAPSSLITAAITFLRLLLFSPFSFLPPPTPLEAVPRPFVHSFRNRLPMRPVSSSPSSSHADSTSSAMRTQALPGDTPALREEYVDPFGTPVTRPLGDLPRAEATEFVQAPAAGYLNMETGDKVEIWAPELDGFFYGLHFATNRLGWFPVTAVSFSPPPRES